MPWILFVDRNNDNEEYYIPCVELPPGEKGAVGRITIANIRRRDPKSGDILTIPYMKKQKDITMQKPELVITGKIEDGHLCIPLGDGYEDKEFAIGYKYIANE